MRGPDARSLPLSNAALEGGPSPHPLVLGLGFELSFVNEQALVDGAVVPARMDQSWGLDGVSGSIITPDSSILRFTRPVFVIHDARYLRLCLLIQKCSIAGSPLIG